MENNVSSTIRKGGVDAQLGVRRFAGLFTKKLAFGSSGTKIHALIVLGTGEMLTASTAVRQVQGLLCISHCRW
jgi:hypothetical protein